MGKSQAYAGAGDLTLGVGLPQSGMGGHDMTDNERDLLLVAKDLLEICRIKCSPTDEVWRRDGITNEQVMIAAMRTIKRVVEEE